MTHVDNLLMTRYNIFINKDNELYPKIQQTIYNKNTILDLFVKAANEISAIQQKLKTITTTKLLKFDEIKAKYDTANGNIEILNNLFDNITKQTEKILNNIIAEKLASLPQKEFQNISAIKNKYNLINEQVVKDKKQFNNYNKIKDLAFGIIKTYNEKLDKQEREPGINEAKRLKQKAEGLLKKAQDELKYANELLTEAQNGEKKMDEKIEKLTSVEEKIQNEIDSIKQSAPYLRQIADDLTAKAATARTNANSDPTNEEAKIAAETAETAATEAKTAAEAAETAATKAAATAAGITITAPPANIIDVEQNLKDVNEIKQAAETAKKKITAEILKIDTEIKNIQKILESATQDNVNSDTVISQTHMDTPENIQKALTILDGEINKTETAIGTIDSIRLNIIGYVTFINAQISDIDAKIKDKNIENILERATNIRLLNDYIKYYDDLYKGGEINIEYKDEADKNQITNIINQKLKTLFNMYYKIDINIIKINKLTIYIEILYILIQLCNNGDNIKLISETMIYSIEKIIEFINNYESYNIEFNTTHKKLINHLKELMESCKIITTYDTTAFDQFTKLYDAAKDLIFEFHNRTKILANQLYNESLLFGSIYKVLYITLETVNDDNKHTDIISQIITYIEQIETFKQKLNSINYNKNDTKEIIVSNTIIYENNNNWIIEKEKFIKHSDNIDSQIKKNLLKIIDGEIRKIKDTTDEKKIANITRKFQKELKLVEPKESKIVEISKKIWEKIKFRKGHKLMPTPSAKPTPTPIAKPTTPSITPSSTPSIKSNTSSIPAPKEKLNTIYKTNFPDATQDPQEKAIIKDYLDNIQDSKFNLIFSPLVAKYLAYIDPKQIENVPKTINNIFIRFFGMAIFVALSIFIILMATTKGEFGPKNLDVIMGFNIISAAIITLVIFLSFIACEKLNGVAINLNIYKILFFIGLFVFIFLFLSIMDYSGINVYLYVSEKNKDLINPNLQKINELRNEDSIFKTFIYIFIIFVVLFIGYNMLNMFRLSYAFKVGNGINNSKWSIILFFIINIIGINITLDIITKYKTYKNHESSYFTMNFIYSLFSGFIYLIYQNIRKKEAPAP